MFPSLIHLHFNQSLVTCQSLSLYLCIMDHSSRSRSGILAQPMLHNTVVVAAEGGIMKRLLLMLLAFLPTVIFSEQGIWIHNGFTYCQRVATTFVQREPSVCGSNTVYCITPIECWGYNSYRSIGIASCKAHAFQSVLDLNSQSAKATASSVVPSARFQCPGLQACADDPRPDLTTEAQLWRWNSPVVSSLTPTPTLSRESGSGPEKQH